MKIVLPPQLSFGSVAGSIDPPNQCGTFFVKGAFRLRHEDVAVPLDEPVPVSGDLHEGEDPTAPLRYPSDFAMFKPRADVIVVGDANAPEPVRSLRVGVAVGPMVKVEDLELESGTFTRATLAHRWEGEPPGLPRKDTRIPEAELTGFGPMPAAWPPRRRLVGSYDGDYVKARWPWFPADFDWGYFNAAPRDQQVAGYLRGDEDVVLQHLHPAIPVFRSKLPGLRVRCFIQIRGDDGRSRKIREVSMKLDTVWIDAQTASLILVWRGLAEVRTPKMREVLAAVIATEPLAEAPREASEYLEVLDEDRTVFSPPPSDRESVRNFRLLDQEMAEMSKQIEAMEAEIAAAEKKLVEIQESTTLDLADGAPPIKPAPPMTTQLVAEGIRSAFDAAIEQQPDLASKLNEIDLSEFAKLEAEFTAAQAASEKEEAEDQARRWTRERVAAASAAGQPIVRADLSGLDLSQLDLTGIDFTGSLLRKARLSGTSLVRAKLTAANLSGADLSKADLCGAVLDFADLSGARLEGAKLLRLSLNSARLAKLKLSGADFTGSVGNGANFAGSLLAGAVFVRARLPEADFTGAALAKADFSEALLTNARFGGVIAPDIVFVNADAEGLRADENANLSRARLQGINAPKAVFDTAKLDGADFAGALLVRAQFEGCSLRGAVMDRADLTAAQFDDADLRGAALTHANLLRASLEGSDLEDADLKGANGFEVGFWRSKAEKAHLAGANLKRTLLA